VITTFLSDQVVLLVQVAQVMLLVVLEEVLLSLDRLVLLVQYLLVVVVLQYGIVDQLVVLQEVDHGQVVLDIQVILLQVVEMGHPVMVVPPTHPEILDQVRVDLVAMPGKMEILVGGLHLLEQVVLVTLMVMAVMVDLRVLVVVKAVNLE
jgi:hypothetical protein|tara:strand:+ start:26 stop:475 length:450 start_codon:yes stop_codon:yes gene_type:complete